MNTRYTHSLLLIAALSMACDTSTAPEGASITPDTQGEAHPPEPPSTPHSGGPETRAPSSETMTSRSQGLIIASVTESAQLSTHSLSARFEDSCALETVGACVIRTCDELRSFREAPNVGAIFVTGEQFAARVVRGDNRLYRTVGDSFALWTGGEKLRFYNEGGELPKFEAEVRGPGTIEMRSPVFLPLPHILEISRSEVLPVTWFPEPSSRGDSAVHAILSTTDRRTSLDCSAPVTATGLQISPEALGRLPQGPGSITVEVRNSTSVAAGDWSLEIRASRAALSHNGEFVLTAIDIH